MKSLPHGHEIGMRMVGGGKGQSGESLRLLTTTSVSPPIANTLEAAVAKAPRVRHTKISEEAMRTFHKYLHTENPNKPYSDSQIINYLQDQGYKWTRRKVALGKAILRSRLQSRY